MSKLYELMGIIYDYDDFISHWIGGERADLYETDEGKRASEVADELFMKASKIIDNLRDEETCRKSIEELWD